MTAAYLAHPPRDFAAHKQLAELWRRDHTDVVKQTLANRLLEAVLYIDVLRDTIGEMGADLAAARDAAYLAGQR